MPACKKAVLKISQNAQEYTCVGVSLLIMLQIYLQLRPATLFKKKTLTYMFSCEFCKVL